MGSEIVINKGYNDVNPVQFGYEKCKSLHSFGPATRFYWLFHFVVSGRGKFYINNKCYSLSEGMMFVIPPFVETFYQADDNEPWEYIWIGFSGKPPLDLEDTYNIPNAFHIFEGMKLSHNYKKGRTEFLLSKIWELFSVLIEEKPQASNSVDTALNLIHSEYMLPITVQQIADRIHLERTYFSNIFFKRIGVSPKQYLLNYRMEKAVVLLQQGHSVTTTAFSVGYSDVYTFSKMFKRHFGSSPSKYFKEIHK
ncbi:MAG: AraC family transcriptional regulator [Ruminococcaceae bacterium]|nr:AraC family transcriptional regulator [Oscillospiraceae bacterium]